MPLDKSRIQGFGSESQADEGKRKKKGSRAAQQESGFWGVLDTVKDRMGGPAVQSAIDNVALRVGDVFDAATQDVSEMASDFKTFVSSTMGLEDDSDQELEESKREVSYPPEQRSEALEIVSRFCEKYPATRVAPNEAELQRFWTSCSVLHYSAVSSAIYEQLSFNNGDFSWQPRLRALYAIDYLYRSAGQGGRDITASVMQSAGPLIQHLSLEVPQCREKASQVIITLSGKAEQPAPPPPPAPSSSETASSSAPSTAKAADLLDVTVPVVPAPSASASSSSRPAVAPVDLLSAGDLAPTTQATAPAPAPSDLNLLGGLLEAVPATQSQPTLLTAPPAPSANVRAAAPAQAIATPARSANVDLFQFDVQAPGSSEASFDPNTPMPLKSSSPNGVAWPQQNTFSAMPMGAMPMGAMAGAPAGSGAASAGFGLATNSPTRDGGGFALPSSPSRSSTSQGALNFERVGAAAGFTFGESSLLGEKTLPYIPAGSELHRSVMARQQSDPFDFVTAHTGISKTSS